VAHKEFILVKKKFKKEFSFTYKIPDLTDKKLVGGDTDAIYLANPIDLEKYLIKRNFKIIDITGNKLIGKNKLINKVFHSWKSIALVARKI